MIRPFKFPFVVYILTTVEAAFRGVKFTESSLGILKFGHNSGIFSTGELQISLVVSRDFDVNKPLFIRNLVFACILFFPLLEVRMGHDSRFTAVDKTRNMEHSGTCRNIPEHPGT